MRTAIVPVLALLSLNANAAIWCTGNVTKSLVYANGDLMIVGTWRNS